MLGGFVCQLFFCQSITSEWFDNYPKFNGSFWFIGHSIGHLCISIIVELRLFVICSFIHLTLLWAGLNLHKKMNRLFIIKKNTYIYIYTQIHKYTKSKKLVWSQLSIDELQLAHKASKNNDTPTIHRSFPHHV